MGKKMNQNLDFPPLSNITSLIPYALEFPRSRLEIQISGLESDVAKIIMLEEEASER